MIKKLLKPHLLLFVFFLIMGFSIVPKNNLLVFTILGLAVYASIVIFFSKKLKESQLTLLISLVFNLIIFIVLFNVFRPDPFAYANDHRDYVFFARLLYAHKEYGILDKIPPETVQIFGINFGERVLEPTAYRPIGYPLFIAILFFITRSTNYINIILVQYLLHLISLFLFWKISKKILGEKLSSISTVLYSLNAPLIFACNVTLSENLAQFLLISLIYFSLLAFFEKPSLFKIIVGGISGGLLILVRPIFIFAIPILFLTLAYKFIKDKKVSKKALTLTGVLIFTCSIWIFRNSILAGKLTSVATNGGINMFMGNNPWASNGRATYWPENELKELLGDSFLERKIKSEVVIDDKLKKVTTKWIISNPMIFSRLAISKAEQLLLPHKDLFDNLEHLNYPRVDKFYLILSYQAVFLWIFLFLSVIGLSEKKSLPIILITAPYFGMIFLAFAVTRFQLPLYIPIALLATYGIEVIKDIKKANKTILVLALLIFIKFFFKWGFTIVEPLKDYGFRNKIAQAEMLNNDKILTLVESDHGNSDKFITKVFDQNTYEKASLSYKGQMLDLSSFKDLLKQHKVITYNIDCFDYLDTEFINSFGLVYKGQTANLPYFEIVDKENLNIKEAKVLSANLFTGLEGKLNTVYTGTPELNAKYIFISLTLSKGSIIDISGKEDIKLTFRPRFKDMISTDILIPNEYLYQGFNISIKNNSFPNNPENISIYINNKYLWEPNQTRINNLSVLF